MHRNHALLYLIHVWRIVTADWRWQGARETYCLRQWDKQGLFTSYTNAPQDDSIWTYCLFCWRLLLLFVTAHLNNLVCHIFEDSTSSEPLSPPVVQDGDVICESTPKMLGFYALTNACDGGIAMVWIADNRSEGKPLLTWTLYVWKAAIWQTAHHVTKSETIAIYMRQFVL